MRKSVRPSMAAPPPAVSPPPRGGCIENVRKDGNITVHAKNEAGRPLCGAAVNEDQAAGRRGVDAPNCGRCVRLLAAKVSS